MPDMTPIRTPPWYRVFSLPKEIRKALQDAGHEHTGRGAGPADPPVVGRFPRTLRVIS